MSFTNIRDHNIAVAGALAVVAAVLTMIYVSRGGGSERAQAAAPRGAHVWVATRDIPTGTAAARLFTGGYVQRKTLATADVAPGAITDRRQLHGLVTVQPVYDGEQLTERRFGPSGVNAAAADLKGAMRIIQLAGSKHQLLAGILKPGDHVDVVAAIKNPLTERIEYGRIVLRNLLVLDAGQARDTATTPNDESSWVTLELRDNQARTLFFVVKTGEWSLALRPFVRPANGTDALTSVGSLARPGGN